MNERDTWNVIGSNLPILVEKMLTLKKNESIDVYCDQSGKNLSFSKPGGQMNVKLCRLTAPDLEGSYDIRKRGDAYINGDGEEIPKDQLADYITQSIIGMRDGGAEWGWEFKIFES